MRRYISILISLGLILSLLGCSPEFSKIGSELLTKSGFVSSSEAESIFAVGNKLSKATQSVTDEQEYYLGRSVAAMILSRYKIVRNKPVDAYLNKIALTLASSSSKPETFGGYKVAVIDSPQINAVSAPGGFIFISSGLLYTLSSEDELAAVIAHEIAHVALRHGVSAISDSNLTDALQIIGKQAAESSSNVAVSELNSLFGDSVNEIVGTLLDSGYSRSAEYDADTYAQALILKAGYNPSALKESLEAIKHSTATSGGWSDTHPKPEKRIKNLSEVQTQGNNLGKNIRDSRFRKIIQNG